MGDIPAPIETAPGRPRPARRPARDLGRLLVACPDRPGIVAAVSRFLFERGANIVHSDQHSTDPHHDAGTFFLRVEFRLADLAVRRPEIAEAFGAVAEGFKMAWRLAEASRPVRLAVFVSREEHALLELLWRRRAGDLRAEIAMVVSNHPDLAPVAGAWGVPFHHVAVPADAAGKASAEARQLALLDAGAGVDAVVLARYMQVLGPAFIDRYPHRIINIHHGFLPAFAGANPYAQAHTRGVKVIGATAHYVTAELDAGPIIEQDVQRVDHRHTVADLRRLGRYIERVVLARAVEWHAEDRTLVHGDRTIVFS